MYSPSRSHAIFTLLLEQLIPTGEEESGANIRGEKEAKEKECRQAKFHFVDLAGSERYNHSHCPFSSLLLLLLLFFYNHLSSLITASLLLCYLFLFSYNHFSYDRISSLLELRERKPLGSDSRKVFPSTEDC